MDPLLACAIPGGAILLGLFAFCAAKVTSWNFDRKHPHLSRAGMRALARQRSPRNAPRVPPTSLPWTAQELSLGRKAEVEEPSLENAIEHLGRNITSDLNRKRSREQSAA